MQPSIRWTDDVNFTTYDQICFTGTKLGDLICFLVYYWWT